MKKLIKKYFIIIFKFYVIFIESSQIGKKNTSLFDPLVYKAINTNPFDFENDSIIVKSYLKKLLMTKNFSLAFEINFICNLDIKPRMIKLIMKSSLDLC